MFLRSTIIRSYQYTTVKRHLYSNYPKNLKTKPDANDTAEFIYNSIKVIVLSSVIWGFESNRKYHLHHLCCYSYELPISTYLRFEYSLN